MTRFGDFEEIVLCDFEFYGGDGNRPIVVCVVAHELKSGRKFRLWQDQLGPEPPYRVDDKTLFVAFYAAAELTCHLALDWPMPRNVLDMFAEFRRLTNHSGKRQTKSGILAAQDYFHIDSIEAQAKEHWRAVIMRGPPWTAEEREGIVDYCETDVGPLQKLLEAMPIPNLGQALLRGSYMRAEAWMRHWGIPIDGPLYRALAAHWPELRQRIIDDLNSRFPVFDGSVLKQKLLERMIQERGIQYWPLTPSGRIATDAETLRAIAQRCPEMAEFCMGKISLDQLKTFKLMVGGDNRNRCMLSAFASKTGRNQPSNSNFAFGLNAAFRSLIKPSEGNAIAYLDFSGQEFAEAAYFSGDQNMIAAYESGDPYSDWARKAGAMPANGNKHTHPHIRAVYKRAALGVIYGMGAKTLGEYVGVSETRARELLRSHRKTFPQFWRWSDAVYNSAIATRELQTVYGWRMRVLPDAKSRTILNYPMQSNGAEMLRLACCYAVDRGLKIIAPIHDAILLEAPSDQIDADVAALTECMVAASRVVLGGHTVRVDASKPIHFPDRYVDGRDGAPELWAMTMRLLSDLTMRRFA
jgi:DNA polymerase-1